MSLALILVVVGEMAIGSNRGLGKVVNDMRSTDAVPEAYAALLCLGIIGFIYNKGLLILQKRIVHWQGR